MTDTDAQPVDKYLPNPIRTDSSNDFAHKSMAVRVPGIIKDIIARNPDYPVEIREELQQLHDEIVDDSPIRLFSLPAPDYDLWTKQFEAKKEETWLNTEWLFAEILVYRLIVDITRYWTSLRDPFAPFKQDELASKNLWSALSKAMDKSGSPADRLVRCLEHALWGNRIDLSLKQAAKLGTSASEDHLLSNDIPIVVDYLMENSPGTIHIIMDNAGTEQALDLVLVDHLLSQGIAEKVVLHVKMHPVLVSDAIVADMHNLLDRMTRHSTVTNLLAIRIKKELERGRISMVPDFFWNTADRLWQIPPRLRLAFEDAKLVIAKGDFNYRRATNDALWPPSATLLDAIQDFPFPLLALRTLKSDTLVGIPENIRTRLDEENGPEWRTSGTYGVAQFAH